MNSEADRMKENKYNGKKIYNSPEIKEIAKIAKVTKASPGGVDFDSALNITDGNNPS